MEDATMTERASDPVTDSGSGRVRGLTGDEVVRHVLDNFLVPARAAAQVPMTAEQSRAFMGLMMMPDDRAEEAWVAVSGRLGFQFQAAVMDRVAARFDAPVSAQVKLFLLVLAQNPGEIVLYLTYAVWRLAGWGEPALDLSALADVFPTGFWGDETLRRLWGAQKLPPPGDNGVDTAAFLRYLSHLRQPV